MNFKEYKKELFKSREFRATALEVSIQTETWLETFISEYFISDNKRYILEDIVLSRLTFNEKIDIFYDVCKSEKIDKILRKTTRKSLDKIRKQRNVIAHWNLFPDFSGNMSLIQKNYDLDQKQNIKDILESVLQEQINIVGALSEISNMITKRKNKP